jgi:hypothetical protein
MTRFPRRWNENGVFPGPFIEGLETSFVKSSSKPVRSADPTVAPLSSLLPTASPSAPPPPSQVDPVSQTADQEDGDDDDDDDVDGEDITHLLPQLPLLPVSVPSPVGQEEEEDDDDEEDIDGEALPSLDPREVELNAKVERFAIAAKLTSDSPQELQGKINHFREGLIQEYVKPKLPAPVEPQATLPKKDPSPSHEDANSDMDMFS